MKQGQGIGKRIIPLVLTIAMLFGMICTPAGQIRASAAEAYEDTPMAIAAATGPVVMPNDHGSYDVTFSFQWDADNVEVRGTLPGVGWDGVEMEKGSGNVWTTTIEDVAPGTYQYKFFTNGNGWEKDPNNKRYWDVNDNCLIGVGYKNPTVEGTTVTLKYIPEGHVNSVYVHGTFGDGGAWMTPQMSPDENGVYSYTFTATPETKYQYKFQFFETDGPEHWTTDPGNANDLENGNSQFTITEPVEEPPVHIDPDNFISPEINGKEVTFRYLAKEVEHVWLIDELMGWDTSKAVEMEKDENGVWSITEELPNGGHQYKFLVGDKNGWKPDPKNLNPLDGNGNSLVLVGYQSPVVSGSSVTITYFNPSATSGTVQVVGSMTNWDESPIPMVSDGNGLFTGTINNLKSGTYEYKLIYVAPSGDITWLHDPLNLAPLIGNYGDNNQFTIEVSPDHEHDPDKTDVTFRYEAPNANSVELAGTMTGWEGVLMDRDDNGVWSITKQLETGTYQYKFIVNDEKPWFEDPSNPILGSDGNSYIAVGYESGIVDGSNVTIKYINKNTTAESIEIAGTLPGIDWETNHITMNPDEHGVYTHTFTDVPNGDYEYKLIINGNWVADPANKNDLVGDNHNSMVIVTGSVDPPAEVISPEVNGHDVTFRYKNDGASKVELMGTLPGINWDIDNNPMLSKSDETGYWEITRENVPGGKYQYKFVINGASDGWTNDPLNTWKDGNDNIVVVTGLAFPTDQTVQAGTSITLPDTLDFYAADGSSSTVGVAYELNGTYEGVTLLDHVLHVPEGFDGESITITVTADGDTADFKVKVYSTVYTYDIYYFDWNSSHMGLDTAALWLWEDGKEGSEYPFSSTEEINGKTWLKATVQFPFTKLGVIVRSKGGWTWQTTPNYFLTNSEGEANRSAYVVFGKGLTMDNPPELPDTQPSEFYVPGTFPGPNWDAVSNQMGVYDAANKIYSYTFHDVPPATYEFKIAAYGSWDTNYGVDGKSDGSNYSVTVPEKMDVTVYYSDVSHLAVTNLNYEFVKPIVIGLDSDLVLTDTGLTGIYSGTAKLPAGTYTDLKLQVDDDELGTFTSFTLDSWKAVTFYYAPASKVWYSNAVPWDAGATVYYNSQDITYKNPFGAVATDEKVTFSVDAASSITGVSLVIGSNKYAMKAADGAAAGMQRWTTEVSFPSIGQYRYYFLIHQDGGVKVYCDDDGYYGTGMLAELTQAKPYDIVVYDKDYHTPEWMKNAVIYQIFPDRFFDGNPNNNQAQLTARGSVNYEFPAWNLIPENPEQKDLLSEEAYLATGAFYGDGEWSNEIYGGDLKGITEKIEYLKSLGVTVIYLNPVFASISNHRYDTSDYTQIDPILGTMEDYQELVAAAKANNMHIILDGVFNHVSDDSIYFDRYYKFLGTSEKVGAYPYWAYVYDLMNEQHKSQPEAEAAAQAYFRERYNITDFSYTTWFDILNEPMEGSPTDSMGAREGKPVYAYDGWWGYDSMPIIKSTNGSEFQTTDWAEEIITNKNSVTRYWLQNGNNGWRLDVANEVSDETWQHFRQVVKSEGDFVIIGEIWDDATKYLLGDMYDSTMNYMFRNAVTAFAMGTSAEQTTKDMERIRERYPKEALYAMMNLVDSHDTSRVLSYLDGIGDDRSDKSIEAAFPHYNTTSKTAKERQKLVAFLQFTYAGAPTIYYGDERGMVGGDDPDDRRTIADWDNVTDPELLAWYQKLGSLRTRNATLRTGSVEPFDAGNSHILGYVRRDTDKTIIVLANNAATDQTVTLNLADLDIEADYLMDLITSTGCSAVDGILTVTVPAYRGVILADGEILVDPPVIEPDPSESEEPSKEPVVPTAQPSKEPVDPTTEPSTEPDEPTAPPSTEPTQAPEVSDSPSQPSYNPWPSYNPAPSYSPQPSYYPQPSYNPAPSTQPTPSPSQPSPAPSAPVEDLPDLDTPLSGLPAEVTHETTVRLDSVLKDGVLTAELPSTLQDAILSHAEENDSTTIVVAPKLDEKATHNDVVLPGALLDKLADMGGIDVRVETPVGNVTIPDAALDTLGDAKQVSVCLEKKTDAVEVTVKADSETLKTVPGGVKAALNLDDGQVAVLVDSNGKETVLPKSLVEEGKTYAILPGSGTVKLVTRSVVFNDVPADSWFADAVSFASSHDLFSGISETELVFAPTMEVDRSMTATMLWALESKIKPESTAPFPDVGADAWYAASVAWASENGIVAGYGTGEFAPADTITREQFVTMMYNYVQYLGVETSHTNRMQTFSDANTVSTWSQEAMEWAVGSGLINGNGNQELKPKDTITRAQAAAALKNLISLIVKE